MSIFIPTALDLEIEETAGVRAGRDIAVHTSPKQLRFLILEVVITILKSGLLNYVQDITL
jgi:hypothetical protein